MLSEFRRAAGADLAGLAAERIDALLREGYAELSDERLSLTVKGYPFADRFALQLIDDVERAR
jgi:hypothetical protein